MKTGLALIAAVAENGVIGRGGDLPWRLPDDLRHFKRTTLGHCLIMGRKTWSSLPGPLPGRTSIVLSHDSSLRAEGAHVAGNLDEAIAIAAEAGDREPIVAGGAALYALALPHATRFWLTRVAARIEGDVAFPEWKSWQQDEGNDGPPAARSGWRLLTAEPHRSDERHPYAFTIEHWLRHDR